MLDLVEYVPVRNLSSVSIIEPSCGEGDFLVEIVHRLKQSSEIHGFNFNLAYNQCVHAFDIDARKIERSIAKIALQFPQLTNPDGNILQEDYLLNTHQRVDIIVGNPPYIRYEEILVVGRHLVSHLAIFTLVSFAIDS